MRNRQSVPRKRLVLKSRRRREVMSIPMRCKAIVFQMYNDVEDDEERDHEAMVAAMLPALNKSRVDKGLLPVAVPLDEDGFPCHPDDGGEVEEGHQAIVPSYYDKALASRMWGLQNDLVKAAADVRSKSHKAAVRMIEEYDLEHHFFSEEEIAAAELAAQKGDLQETRKVFGVAVVA